MAFRAGKFCMEAAERPARSPLVRKRLRFLVLVTDLALCFDVMAFGTDRMFILD